MAYTWNKLRSEQIHHLDKRGIVLGWVTLAADMDGLDITSAVTSALATSGRGGVAVPVQLSADLDTQGIVVGNESALVDALGKNDVILFGQRVYVVVTENAGAYTANFKILDEDGNEQDATVVAGDYDIVFEYRFNFDTTPETSSTELQYKQVVRDPSAAGKTVKEILTITALNTLSDLTNNPKAWTLEIDVNGQTFLEGEGAFAVDAKTITSTLDYDIQTTFKVKAKYITLD